MIFLYMRLRMIFYYRDAINYKSKIENDLYFFKKILVFFIYIRQRIEKDPAQSAKRAYE